MKVALVQMVLSETPEVNRARAADLLSASGLEGPALILFPELFSTGFSKTFATGSLPFSAATIESEDRDFFSGLAKKYRSYVLGAGLGFGKGYGSFLNQSFLFDPEGRCVRTYRKIHPFSFSGEDEAFESGKDLALAELPGMRLCQTICYDLRFPELFRAGLDAGADVFSVQANWPVSRKKHWETLLQARAIENQAWVIAVNNTGKFYGTDYFGGSQIVSPRGECLLEWTDREGILIADIDPGESARWRKLFPALRDRKGADFYSQKKS